MIIAPHRVGLSGKGKIADLKSQALDDKNKLVELLVRVFYLF